MIDDIINLYKIGKDLGLTKKEINKILFFEKRKHLILFLVFVLLIITSLAISIIILKIEIGRNTYPSGTKYSTITIKDFQRSRWSNNRLKMNLKIRNNK